MTQFSSIGLYDAKSSLKPKTRTNQDWTKDQEIVGLAYATPNQDELKTKSEFDKRLNHDQHSLGFSSIFGFSFSFSFCFLVLVLIWFQSGP